jgi:hypothetical protein
MNKTYVPSKSEDKFNEILASTLFTPEVGDVYIYKFFDSFIKTAVYTQRERKGRFRYILESPWGGRLFGVSFVERNSRRQCNAIIRSDS